MGCFKSKPKKGCEGIKDFKKRPDCKPKSLGQKVKDWAKKTGNKIKKVFKGKKKDGVREARRWLINTRPHTGGGETKALQDNQNEIDSPRAFKDVTNNIEKARKQHMHTNITFAAF